MKKVILSTIFLVLLGSPFFTTSCRKADKIKGCTDKDSKNYDKTAEVNDGSCLYQGAVVFWYDQVASEGLMADNASSLSFSLDGEIIGTSLTKDFWASAPTCGQEGSVTVLKELGGEKSIGYLLSVKDQTGFEYWNATVKFNANTCLMFQLLWNKKKK